MPLLLNMDKIEQGSLSLKGRIPLSDLDMETLDDLIKPTGPLEYNIIVKKNDESIELQGSLDMILQCECARCLQPFEYQIHQKGWNCKIPLKGDDSIEIKHGTVDLTPYLREYTFLAFPRHPLCENEKCIINPLSLEVGDNSLSKPTQKGHKDKNPWVELDKLNLD